MCLKSITTLLCHLEAVTKLERFPINPIFPAWVNNNNCFWTGIQMWRDQMEKEHSRNIATRLPYAKPLSGSHPLSEGAWSFFLGRGTGTAEASAGLGFSSVLFKSNSPAVSRFFTAKQSGAALPLSRVWFDITRCQIAKIIKVIFFQVKNNFFGWIFPQKLLMWLF